MLKTKNLSKTFPNNTIIYPDITAKNGDFILLTGKTGCGKTTFCEIIAKFLPYENGTICLNDCNIKYQNVFETIHYLSQFPENNLIGPTCSDELEIWLKYNPPAQKESINNILTRFNLENHLNTPIWQLSYGQKKLLAFLAISIIQRKLWLLDEPFAGLDSEQTQRISDLMKDFIENKGIIIATSHTLKGVEGFEKKIVKILL